MVHPRVTLKHFFKDDEHYRKGEKNYSHHFYVPLYTYLFSVIELHCMYFARILEQNELVQLDLLDHNR